MCENKWAVRLLDLVAENMTVEWHWQQGEKCQKDKKVMQNCTVQQNIFKDFYSIASYLIDLTCDVISEHPY